MSSYRMPAEWATHRATYLTWPHNHVHWPKAKLKRVEKTYCQMIRALLAGEMVELLIPHRDDDQKVRRLLGGIDTSNLRTHVVKTQDVWIRDYGPTFVKRQATSNKQQDTGFVKWIFNAWGNKYLDLRRDNGVIDRLRILKKYPRISARMVLEGGSIDVNGQGLCLTTEQCLLNPNRNPLLSKKDIERALGRYLGVNKVIWLRGGIVGDDTDGHVDDVARFVGPNTVLAMVESDRKSKNYGVLRENLEILNRTWSVGDTLATHQSCIANMFHSGPRPKTRLQIIELPMPKKFGKNPQKPLPASYANFLISNAAILVPIFKDPNDSRALKTLATLFPRKNIVGIDCRLLVEGFGAIHCASQQEPT